MSEEYWFTETDSTMEAAKQKLNEQDFILIVAETQTQGRGSRQRVWQSPAGNIHLTIALNKKFFSPERLALFPLEMGIILHKTIALQIDKKHLPLLSLKWPNDLLMDGKKISGLLMEMTGQHLLIGIGINVAAAPPLNDGGSLSACLQDYGMNPGFKTQLIRNLFAATKANCINPMLPEEALTQWQSKVNWDLPLRLRERPDQSIVKGLGINTQGHLRIRHHNGQEEWLISEYLA